VQDLAHLVFREHQVLTGVVAQEKTKTVAVALHLAGQQVCTRGNQKQPRAIADHPSFALEFREFFVEAFTFEFGRVQALRQFRRA